MLNVNKDKKSSAWLQVMLKGPMVKKDRADLLSALF